MIFAGNLTETLDFYEIVETQSASGYKEVKEIFKGTRKAQRLKNRENMVEDAEEVFHVITLTFRMRKLDIKETDIVVYRKERYRILSIDEFRKEQTIIVEKINE